jgi:hypothetical protein
LQAGISELLAPDCSAFSEYDLCHMKFFDPNHTVLFIVDWDSFFTLVCLKEKAAKLMKPHEFFEGFYSDHTTEHFW